MRKVDVSIALGNLSAIAAVLGVCFFVATLAVERLFFAAADFRDATWLAVLAASALTISLAGVVLGSLSFFVPTPRSLPLRTPSVVVNLCVLLSTFAAWYI